MSEMFKKKTPKTEVIDIFNYSLEASHRAYFMELIFLKRIYHQKVLILNLIIINIVIL